MQCSAPGFEPCHIRKEYIKNQADSGYKSVRSRGVITRSLPAILRYHVHFTILSKLILQGNLFTYFCHPFKNKGSAGEVDEWLKSVVC